MSVSVTIDLPEDIAQLLKERCARTRHTQSQVVAELLRPALLAKETAPPSLLKYAGAISLGDSRSERKGFSS